MIYALLPTLLRDFVTAFETACQSPDGWKAFLSVLGGIHPHRPMHRFRPPSLDKALRHLPRRVPESMATAEEIGEALVESAIPSPEAHARTLKLFAAWTARAAIDPNEPHLFLQAHTLVEEKPHLARSPEWRFVCDHLLKPGRIPMEFPFLKADPHYSIAACITAEEIGQLLALEREERLLEAGTLGLGSDSQALLGLLHVAASERCLVWHYEYP